MKADGLPQKPHSPTGGGNCVPMASREFTAADCTRTCE